MISFDNTEIAFKHKSSGELSRAYFMFRMIGYPTLVRFGKFMIGVARVLRIPIGWAMRGNVFAHFCGGEDIASCVDTAKLLAKHGIGTILDFSVEGQETDEASERTFQEILKTADSANGNDHIPFCVFKVSALASHELLQKMHLCSVLNVEEVELYRTMRDRVDAICQRAAEGRTYVLIDAEESWIQDGIDELALTMMEKYNRKRPVVYNTFQFYRHDRLAYLKEMLETARKNGYHFGAKMVRGAYMEKERERALANKYLSPIQPTKEATDRDFDEAMRVCADNLDIMGVCVGTHNEQSCLLMTEIIAEKQIQRNDPRVYFAQLMGMSDHISFNLASEGYNVAKYVPYGPIREVIPYLIRRAEENTSVKGQSGRELELINRERQRRRKSKSRQSVPA